MKHCHNIAANNFSIALIKLQHLWKYKNDGKNWNTLSIQDEAHCSRRISNLDHFLGGWY